MEHLIPTLLGIAGALDPVAFGFIRQEQPVLIRRAIRPSRYLTGVGIDEAIIRGGRMYL